MTGSAFLARIEFIRQGWEVTGALFGGTVLLNEIREHEPKSALDGERTSGKLTQSVGHVVDHRR